MLSPCQPISLPLCLLSLLLTFAFNIIKCPLLTRNSNNMSRFALPYAHILTKLARTKYMNMLVDLHTYTINIHKGHLTKCHPQLTTHISIAHKQLAATSWGAAPPIRTQTLHTQLHPLLATSSTAPIQVTFSMFLICEKTRDQKHPKGKKTTPYLPF